MERLPGSSCRDLRKRGEVGLIGCLPVKAGMRSAGVVKAKVAGERLPGFGYGIIRLEVYLLVLDGSPESLNLLFLEPLKSVSGWTLHLGWA